MKRLLVIFCIILGSILINKFVITCYAVDSTIAANIIEVNHVANTKDRLWEKIELFFKFSPKDKIDFQQSLVEKRLAELKFIMDNDKGEMIEEVSSRYSTHLGNLTNDVIKNKLTEKKSELLKMLDNHNIILNNLISEVEFESGFWLLLKHDINYVKIYSDQINSL